MNGDSFFKQLKQLCRVVEQGLQGVTQETDNQSKRGPVGAIKRLVDLKTDIQDMQVKKQICLCVSVTLSLFLTFSLSFPFEPTVFFFLLPLFLFFLSSCLSFSHVFSLSLKIFYLKTCLIILLMVHTAHLNNTYFLYFCFSLIY